MRILKNCIRLACCVKIYVPSTINVKENFDNEKLVNETLKFLAEKFGGSTVSIALGAWVSSGGELVKEKISLAFSYCSQGQLEAQIDLVYEYCLKIKRELAQEAIALEINGELYLI